MRVKLFSFIWVMWIKESQCANILCVFLMPSKSHSILGVKLAEGLIQRGHHVSLVTPYDMGNMENFTNIQLKEILKLKGIWQQENKMSDQNGIIEQLTLMVKFMRKLNEVFWEEPEIQKIIHQKPKYDIVITNMFFADGVLAIPYHLGLPSITFCPIGSQSIVNKYTANPNMVYVSNVFYHRSPQSFLGRLTTVAANVLLDMSSRLFLDPIHDELLKKYIPNAPPLEDLKRNVSLILLNSHVSIERPRPYVANMIQIGGFHVQNTKELPTDIKLFLDEAQHGAILFALGSNVLISNIEEEKRNAIFKVLGDLAPMRILFKSEMEHSSLPENIMVREWLPQADILGHPNIKAFISHGGLGGNTESIYHGVPILGIPFFGDQRMNLEEAGNAGYAEMIEISELTEDLFRTKLLMVLNNPKYALNAKKRSALIKDQPVKPIDNAAFWIEHIIKYGNGLHLRNDGMDLTWYQLYMVDIYVFCTILLSLIIIVNYFIIKFAIRLVRILCKNGTKMKIS